MTAATRPNLQFVDAQAAGAASWVEAVDDFLEDVRMARRAPSYFLHYGYVLEPFGRFTGELPPDQVTERHVRAFLAHVAEVGVTGRRGVGARRQNHLRDGLFRFYKWLEQQGYVEGNPVANIPKAHEPQRITRTFTEAQLKALFAAMDPTSFRGLRDRALGLLLLDTGARLTEALNLRLADLDLREGRARIIGKGDREAFLGLSARLRSELRRYLRVRKAALEGIERADSQWLFPNQDGNRLGSRAAEQGFRRYGEAAGIDDVRCSPHTLRHCYAVTLWRNGADLLTVSKALRHTQVQTTQRYLASLGVDDVLSRTRDLSPLNTLDLPPPAGRRMRGAGGSGQEHRG
jgi:integrase/recombinase XerD